MASVKQLVERKENISSIIHFVRKNGETTRMEMCKVLSLSWACVSDLVALLIEDGVLVESASRAKGSVSAAKGRTPTCLSLNAKKFFLGVDINDSGIAITTLSMSGETIASKKWDAECFHDEKALARSVCDKISEMLRAKEDCCGIGVAMEGMRSENGGFLYPMTGGIVSVFPQAFIANHFGLPVSVRHDPECVLYSVAHNCKDCLAVRVDNWIGVAAMKRGKILELPLELGHTRYGDRKLQDILRSCAEKGDYGEIAEALGRSVGNLALLLGIQTCFLAGEVTEWLNEVRDSFDDAFKRVSVQGEYEICFVSDASDGAARLAMTEYPTIPRYNDRHHKE